MRGVTVRIARMWHSEYGNAASRATGASSRARPSVDANVSASTKATF
jgi:hypothetical protein